MADTESLVNELNACAERQDFEGAFKLVRENLGEISKKMQAVGVKDALKKTTKDRLLLSFLDTIEFGREPVNVSLLKLEKLVSFMTNIPGAAGTKVLNPTWGLGTVRRIDSFYRRITVDFKTKMGHQFTYMAACDMLEIAPKDHILVLRETAPADFDRMLKEQPAEFIKAVIRSNGSSMTLVRLEDYCVRNGFVKAVNWKKFWDGARTSLKTDKCVELPAKKTEPILLRAAAEDYGDGWLTSFAHETDPKQILVDVREFVAQKRFKEADETAKKTYLAKLGERLAFAVTAARKVDDALFARLACQVTALGCPTPPADEMRTYLWERMGGSARFVKAAATLPAREVGAMIAFLAVDDAAKTRLYKAIPELCFTAVAEIVAQFGGEVACRAAVGAYMKSPAAPATLTTLIVGKYEQFRDWAELPSLVIILTHAIALGEGRQSGEILRMQNIIRRLFGDRAWLEKVFSWLNPADQVLFFERFQASIAWEASTHHTTVVRMTKIVPALEAHLVKVEKKREYARVTSFRSFALRKRDYLKLINEDMPANVKRIEFAKSYGDLSENAEYQYAKDEQRALMQKQAVMQAELEAVKPDDFSKAMTDEVMPGVTVVCATDAGEKTWHILGEWDNDVALGILSSKTRVATNLMGKKVGENVELPGEDGKASFATVKAILPLPDSIRDWMKLPEGLQI